MSLQQDQAVKGPSNQSNNGRLCLDDLTQENINTIARIEQALTSHRTLSDRISQVIANFCGSMAFVWLHVIWFTAWITFNIIPGIKHIDPFPFSFLTLVVSLEAILLSTFIMINQNQQSLTQDRRNHLNLQIDLLAEQETSESIQMLNAILKHLKIPNPAPYAEAMQEATHPDRLSEQIDQAIEQNIIENNSAP